MKLKILLLLFTMLLVLPMASATYTLVGNYYRCSSNCLESGSGFDAGSKGIWITGGTHSYTFPDGSGDDNGYGGTVTLSSDYGIRIDSGVTFSLIGGDGSNWQYYNVEELDNEQCRSVDDSCDCEDDGRNFNIYDTTNGGNGGSVILLFDAPTIIIDGATMTATGGDAADGNDKWTEDWTERRSGSGSDCDECDESYGVIKTGNGCFQWTEDWCPNGYGTYADCDDASGGSGGTGTIQFTGEELILDGILTTNTNGGSGGDGGSDAGDGDNGGSANVNINMDYTHGTGSIVGTLDAGNGGIGRGDIECTPGGSCSREDGGGGEGGHTTFSIKQVNITSINVNQDGGTGGTAYMEYEGSYTNNPSDYTGDGGDTNFYINSHNLPSYVGTLTLNMDAGNSGDGNTQFVTGDTGGTSEIYLYGDTTIDIASFTMWGGDGGDGAEEEGGQGGNALLISDYGVLEINGGTINIDSGDGGDGEYTTRGDGNSHDEDGGNAGTATISLRDGTIMKADIDLDGGYGGDISGHGCSNCLGGNANLYFGGNVTFNSSQTYIKGGDGGRSRSRQEAGNSNIYNTGILENLNVFNSRLESHGGDGEHWSSASYTSPGIARVNLVINDTLRTSNSQIYSEAGNCEDSVSSCENTYLTIDAANMWLGAGTTINSNADNGVGIVSTRTAYQTIRSDMFMIYEDAVTINPIPGSGYISGDFQNFYFDGTRAVLGLLNTWISGPSPWYTHVYANNDPDCIEVIRSGRTDQRLTFHECTVTGEFNDAYTDLISVEKIPDRGVDANILTNDLLQCVINIDIGSETITPVLVDFTWYKNDTWLMEDTGVEVYNGENWAPSTVPIGDTNIGDTFYCNVTVYSDNSTTVNDVSHTATVVPTYPYNVKLDIGQTGVYDYETIGELATKERWTLAELNLLNEYLRDCTADDPVNRTCAVPFYFVNDRNAPLNMSNISIIYGTENATADNYEAGFFVWSDTAGNLTFSNLNIEYDTIERVKVRAHVDETYEYNASEDIHYITVVESTFNFTQVPDYEYLEFYPSSITDKDVPPFGGNPFWKIATTGDPATCKPMDIFVRLNETASVPDCINITFTTTYGSAVINETPQQIYFNQSCFGTGFDVDVTIDLECTWAELGQAMFNPIFVFDSLCTECVWTFDAFD